MPKQHEFTVKGLLPPKGLRKIARRTGERIEDAFFPEAESGLDQWQRVVMNRAIAEHLASLGPGDLSAAEISGDSHADRPWKQYTSLNYPEFDICAPVSDPGRFDVVICEQVLEHVVDPCAAAVNLRALTVPGGHVIVSTPFLIKVHEIALFAMHDYWRFTPRGLRALLERGGLVVDTVSTWGNWQCVVGNLRRWPSYRGWHPLRNDPDLAVQVWAFARNPEGGTPHEPQFRGRLPGLAERVVGCSAGRAIHHQLSDRMASCTGGEPLAGAS